MKKFILSAGIFYSILLTTSFAQSWSINGNSNTDPSTNFLGTTNNKHLVLKTNNAEQMRITSAGKIGIGTSTPKQILDVKGNINIGKGFSLYMENRRVLRIDSLSASIALGNQAGGIAGTGFGNTSTGFQSLFALTAGSDNSAFGAYTLTSNTTGTYNTANGYRALNNNSSGNFNTATGAYALTLNTTGNFNAAFGESALSANTTGSSNVAFGERALYSNTTGAFNAGFGPSALALNTTGGYNASVGALSLLNNKDGGANVAVGYSAMNLNTSGNYNTAIGGEALFSNTTAVYNTAAGNRALFTNTTGFNNTADGAGALYFNTTGESNTATGVSALLNNTTGGFNTAVGNYALSNTTEALENTAVGYNAGAVFNNGFNNTFIGAEADAANTDIFNSTALGQAATVTASNQVRIGNGSVTSIGGFANWTNVSDGRVKKNIKENVPGLSFINKLNPVTYNLDLNAADKILQRTAIKDKDGKLMKHELSQTEINARNAKQRIIYSGFIAQDVEKAAKELNYDFSGVDAAKSEKDLYGLRYAEFVTPLVKAVQELSKENDELKSRLEKLESMMGAKQSANTSSQAKTVSISNAALEQNIPNPFNRTTKINYTLPQQYASAKIIITDNTGKSIKQVNISGNGKGSLNVDASTLISGAYQYSLIVDGRTIETKQMVLAK